VGKHGRRGPHPTRRPGPATDLPVTNATSAASPRPGLRDRRSSRRRPGSHRGLHPFRWSRSPATSTWSPPPPPEWEETDASGPTRADTRRLDTARMDTGQLDTGRVDSSRPTAGPSGRRPQVTGHRTAGQPDPGRQTGWVDTACWTAATDAVACLLAVSTTATTPELSVQAGRSCGQTPSGRATTRTAQQQGRRGHPRRHRRVWPPPRPLAAVVRRRPAGASAHCFPRKRLGSRVARDGDCHPLCEWVCWRTMSRLSRRWSWMRDGVQRRLS
jgi:hypothetical protein